MKTIEEKLEEYFKKTSEDKICEDWESTKKYNDVNSPSVNDFLLSTENQRFIAKGHLSTGQPFTYEDRSKDIECFIKYLREAYPTFKIELIKKL